MLNGIDTWGSRAAERTLAYPCDDVLGHQPHRALFRAVTISARPEVVFRWLCQLRNDPYSYDLIDNWGRRSARTLTPGLDALEVGQRFMRIFTLHSFAKDEHLTLELTHPASVRLFGRLAVSYVVRPALEGTKTRLVVKLVLTARSDSWFSRARRELLALGDWFMMRKQLLTLKELAEA